MKLINILTPHNGKFTFSCREMAVTRFLEIPRGQNRKMSITMAVAYNILKNRVGRVNSVLKNYEEFEKIKIITDPTKMDNEGPRGSARNGFYLEMGQIADYLPVMHGVLGFLRGGKTIELALAKASIQTNRHLVYDRALEGRIPFNGAQSFLKNVWPGIWAKDFAESIKRYRSPMMDIVFASFLAHYMGWTKDIEPPTPWSCKGNYEIKVNLQNLRPIAREVPTYFFNSIRAYGTNRYGDKIQSMLSYITIKKPYNIDVYVIPEEIFQQIPFLGKPEGKER